MSTATFFSLEGRFLQRVSGPLDLVILPTVRALGARWAYGAYGPTWHLTDEGVRRRPSNPAVLSGHTISGLPVPCQIVIGDATYECSEPTAEIEFDQPGKYTVIVRAWPYLDREFEIEN